MIKVIGIHDCLAWKEAELIKNAKRDPKEAGVM
jgi:hypothetical protein